MSYHQSHVLQCLIRTSVYVIKRHLVTKLVTNHFLTLNERQIVP